MNISQLFSLNDKTGLVTGGASGIGYSMAEGLLEAGAKVIICGRGRHGSLEAASNKLAQIGPEVIALNCDVSNEENVQKLVKSLTEMSINIDILVNNAGVSWGHPSESLSLEKWKMVIDINLTGTFLMCREVITSLMLPRGLGGSIINISSVAGYKGGEYGVAAYNSSKAGVIGITKQLAIEYASNGIRVNAIAPSWFPSYMSRYFTDKESPMRKTLENQNPMGRLGEQWELKGVVVFLASNASSYITGVVIPVDGGLMSQ